MKAEDVENILSKIDLPKPEEQALEKDLKIPLLSYRRSSKAGLWLLLIPFTVLITIVLKSLLGVQSAYINLYHKLFAAIDNHALLTFLIPIIFVGLPLAVAVSNLLAISHFQKSIKRRELIITIKYRPFNIILLLASFAIAVFFMLPDKLSF